MTIDRAKKVLAIEAKAVAALAERVGEDFLRALELIGGCPGKVIVMGIGKYVGYVYEIEAAVDGTPVIAEIIGPKYAALITAHK